jgi:CRP/FNR family transcriptional regulator, anaerobic regulatory protein
MNAFLEYLKKISPLSQQSMEEFSPRCKEVKHPKGYELVKAGSLCNHLFFVQKGLVKVFYIKDDKEIIDWFADENNITTSFLSFLSRKASLHTVKLLEPSHLISIHYNDLEELFKKHHDVEHIGRILISQAFIDLQERFNSIQFQTALERYHAFLHRYPDCINRISLGDLASFLGITQVTLSRIRAQK